MSHVDRIRSTPALTPRVAARIESHVAITHARRSSSFAASAVLIVAAVGGCADDGALPTEQANVDEVVRGSVTWDHPEIGMLETRNGSSRGICTATLVADNVAITAAHCVHFATTSTVGNYGDVILHASDGAQRRYAVAEYRSFSSRLGADDVALLHLGARVPDSVARPASMADREPTDGTRLAVYGYGCTTRGYGLDGAKRRAEFAQGEPTNRLCPGDSGGPVITVEAGAVLRINSGYYGDAFGTDLFANVPRNFERLAQQVREWSGSDPGTGTPPPSPTPTPPPAPTPPPTDRCGIYAPFPNYTCRRGATGFARCVPGSIPEFLVCPSGYYCTPGSQVLRCYAPR